MAEELTHWSPSPQPEARGQLQVVHRIDPLPELEAPLKSMDIGPLELELGGRLDAVTIGYRAWGRLNNKATNAVLVLHALTGDSLSAGPGGWWSPLIGPGRAIDTDHAFVVCANILG